MHAGSTSHVALNPITYSHVSSPRVNTLLIHILKPFSNANLLNINDNIDQITHNADNATAPACPISLTRVYPTQSYISRVPSPTLTLTALVPSLYKLATPSHLVSHLIKKGKEKKKKKNLKMDMRDQYGNRVGRMDEYGNPIQTEEYGNPITSGTTGGGYGHGTTGGYGTTGTGGTQTTAGYGTTGTGGGQGQMMHTTKEEHRGGGILHRSGSSSSSSSEDDGMGGRRKKKGLKEKIKEKLPGGHKTEEHGYEHGQATGTTGYGGGTTGYGGTTTTTGHLEPEKKGMMEKIKEKLPGHR